PEEVAGLGAPFSISHSFNASSMQAADLESSSWGRIVDSRRYAERICITWSLHWLLERYNARLWGGLVAAKRRKSRPSSEGATTAACYVLVWGKLNKFFNTS